MQQKIANIATKELWLMVQRRAFDRFVNRVVHHDVIQLESNGRAMATSSIL